jgi:transposase
LTPLPKEAIEAIKHTLAGKNLNPIEQSESGPIYAVLYVLNSLAQQIGLTEVLGSSRLGKLSLFLILARIAHQGSRLSAVRWAQDHAVKEILGLGFFDENDLYEALDWIASRQTSIENALYKRYLKHQQQPPRLILYDVTSSYLEGEQNELAAYGYNRDGKKGKKQIVIGLLTSEQGEPLSVEVFEGNTSDPQTLNAQVDKLIERFGIDEVIFVGDRGMIKTQGKAYLGEQSDNHFKYITALTQPQVRKLIRQNVVQTDLFDESVSEIIHGNKRLVLRRNPAVQSKDQHRREDKLRCLKEKMQQRNEFVNASKRANPEVGLKALQRWAKQHRISAFTEITLQERQLQLHIDEEIKKEVSLLDGCYCLETDVAQDRVNKDDIHRYYLQLQKVEQDFRTMKTTLLEIRPIFVRKENRTRGHIFISMLSLKIARLFQQRLQETFGTVEEHKNAESLESALTALSRLCLHHYSIAGQRIAALPRPDSRQQNILSALKVILKAP